MNNGDWFDIKVETCLALSIRRSIVSTSNVVLCYPVTEKDTEKIKSTFHDHRVIVSNQDSIAEDLKQADIFCGHAKVPVDWSYVARQERLKWIQSSAAGLDHCLTPEVIDSEIVVSGCSALFANQVAEHTFALLFGMLRRLPVFMDAASRREFVRKPTDTMHGKTVGIVGFGGNGRRIAALLKELAGSIIATDLFADYEIPEYVHCLPADKLDQVFKECDIVIVTLPLNEQTDKLIGKQQFDLMKPGSYFINVARGSVVDQPSLCTALQDGALAYAAVDVVDPEPLPADNLLWELPNALITPHVGAQAENRVPLTTDLFCLNFERFKAGKTLVNQVDKELRMPHPQIRLSVSRNGEILLPD